MKHLTRPAIAVPLLIFFALNSSRAGVNVLMFHYDNFRTGANTNETLLTPANVNSNTFGKLFQYGVDGMVYAQPLYVSGLSIPGVGTRNVLYIATEHNTVYAFNADSTNDVNSGYLWQTNLGTSAATPDPNFGTRYGTYTDLNPEVGITSTPVIDLASGTLYVDAFTHEGTNYIHRIHALNITNGTERSFSPVVVSASVPGAGYGSVSGRQNFVAKQQMQRCGLTLAGGILYVGYSGFADTDPFHGWLIGFSTTNLQQLTNYVFCTTPNSTVAQFGTNAGEAGVWMSGSGPAVDANNNLYIATGNGVFTATNGSGGTEYGDSILKFSTSNGLTLVDYFTPFNQLSLGGPGADTDLGSGAPILLPDQPGPNPHLLVGGGKEGRVYLLNRDQLTTNNTHYFAGGTTDPVLQTIPPPTSTGKQGRLTGTPSYFNGWVYWGGWYSPTKPVCAFSVNNGLLSSSPVSFGTRTYGFPGTTPVISANGTANGVLWALKYGNPGLLIAQDASNLTNELYNSSQAAGNRDTMTTGVKFSSPIVANGKVYVGETNIVGVYGLLGGNLAFSSPTYSVVESGGTATITVARTGGSSGAAQVNYATVVGGTATPGTDYVSTSGTLSWTNGETAPKTFSVTILDDNIAEPNETINLVLSNSAGAYIGSQSAAVLTILEDSFEAWKHAHFGPDANNPAISGDTADPDGDRILNLLEFALASDPNSAGTEATINGSIVSNHFQFQIRRNTSATNLTFVAQVSTVLGTWNDLMTYTAPSGWVANISGATATESAPIGSAPDAYVNVTIRDPNAVGSPGAGRFFRLLVHK